MVAEAAYRLGDFERARAALTLLAGEAEGEAEQLRALDMRARVAWAASRRRGPIAAAGHATAASATNPAEVNHGAGRASKGVRRMLLMRRLPPPRTTRARRATAIAPPRLRRRSRSRAAPRTRRRRRPRRRPRRRSRRATRRRRRARRPRRRSSPSRRCPAWRRPPRRRSSRRPGRRHRRPPCGGRPIYREDWFWAAVGARAHHGRDRDLLRAAQPRPRERRQTKLGDMRAF